MPVSPRVRELLTRFVAKQRERDTDQKIIFPVSLIRELHTVDKKYYSINRTLKEINTLFEKYGLPTLSDLIFLKLKQKKGKRVKILEVGAGKGNLGQDLLNMKNDLGRPVVEYHGVDLVSKYDFIDIATKRRLGFYTIDVQRERLPRNVYDVVVSTHVFELVPDKLRALENMINSLTVGGTLLLAPIGDFKIDGLDYNLRGEYGVNPDININRDFVNILRDCKGIIVKINSNGGVLIVKKEDIPANFPFDYVGTSFVDQKLALNDLSDARPSSLLELRSHYRSNPNRKPKW